MSIDSAEPFADPDDVDPVEADRIEPGPKRSKHSPVGRMALSRGFVRRKVLIDLARGRSQSDIAREYGVTPQAVSIFKRANKPEIEAMVADLEREYVGLWVASKQNRLAELQQVAEDLLSLLRKETQPPLRERTAAELAALGEDAPSGPDVGTVIDLSRAITQVLRSAAEELGQIPNRVRMEVSGQVTTVRLEGVDMDRL